MEYVLILIIIILASIGVYNFTMPEESIKPLKSKDNIKYVKLNNDEGSNRAIHCPHCGKEIEFEDAKICTNNNFGQKNKWVAFLLALFLGCLGLHKFYLGDKKNGIIMIVLTVTVVGMIVSLIWSLIDAVKILTGDMRDIDGKVLVE